jgi:GT2 family glycosyltransferase
MRAPLISFVVPTRNRSALTEKTVRSILAQGLRPEETEIFVVDNGSTDDTAERIARLRGESSVSIVHHVMATNGGPARSRNWGAAQARGEFVAFVDSDVELREGWALAVVDAFRRHPTVGLITGKILFASDPRVVHCFGGELSRIGLGWDSEQGAEAAGLEEERFILWAPSASVAVRRGCFEASGGFDDTFFYGYEDSDLGWRFNVMGWRCLALPSAVSIHATTAQIDDKVRKVGDEVVFHYAKNRVRSMLKCYSVPTLMRYLPVLLAYSVVDAAARSPRGSKWRALAWNAGRLGETVRLRARVQKARQVSDGTLWSLFARNWFPETRLEKRMEELRHLHGPAAAASGRSGN